MRVAITGSKGLIGSALVQALRWRGDEVVRLVRRAPLSPDERRYDAATARIDGPGLDDVDAVVNLAGEPIADGRWTDQRKREILGSRVQTTRTLVEHLSAHGRCQRLLSGSAIGFYGQTPRGESVDETSGRGDGFPADVAVAWEAEAARSPVPTACLRTGLVLTPRGGLLGKQLLLFQAGLGGRMGDGRQRMSWISLDDEVRAIVHLLGSAVTGPVNLTAPEPVSNERFTAALGTALGRPTVLPVPMPALRLVFGPQLVDEAVLSDQSVLPQVLGADGFEFDDAAVEPALAGMLAKS